MSWRGDLLFIIFLQSAQLEDSFCIHCFPVPWYNLARNVHAIIVTIKNLQHATVEVQTEILRGDVEVAMKYVAINSPGQGVEVFG